MAKGTLDITGKPKMVPKVDNKALKRSNKIFCKSSFYFIQAAVRWEKAVQRRSEKMEKKGENSGLLILIRARNSTLM